MKVETRNIKACLKERAKRDHVACTCCRWETGQWGGKGHSGLFENMSKEEIK